MVQGGESETESSEKNPICSRRSKRVRESRISDFDVFKVRKRTKFFFEDDDGRGNDAVYDQSSPLSSISDTMPEEHVAHCPMMLSKDKWENEVRDYEEESKKFQDDDIFEDSGVEKMAKNKS